MADDNDTPTIQQPSSAPPDGQGFGGGTPQVTEGAGQQAPAIPEDNGRQWGQSLGQDVQNIGGAINDNVIQPVTQAFQGENQRQQDYNQQQGNLAPKIASYLSGKGAMSTDQWNSLQQEVDPQNTMDQSERTMRSIDYAQQQDPQYGVAAIQHARVQYDLYKTAAAKALAQNNFDLAAQEATQAQNYVPDGTKTLFTPYQDGFLSSVRTSDGQTQKFMLSPAQFNSVLRGQHGLFDVATTGMNNILTAVAKSNGRPIQPAPNANPGQNDVIGGGQQEPPTAEIPAQNVNPNRGQPQQQQQQAPQGQAGGIDRSSFMPEIQQNGDALARRAAAMVVGEVGPNAPPEAQTIQLETAFNRAQYRGQPLAQALRDTSQGKGGYYPLQTFTRGEAYIQAHPEWFENFKNTTWKNVLAGSNESDKGQGPMTGNASGSVAQHQAARGTPNYKEPGGDQYFREGPFTQNLPRIAASGVPQGQNAQPARQGPAPVTPVQSGGLPPAQQQPGRMTPGNPPVWAQGRQEPATNMPPREMAQQQGGYGVGGRSRNPADWNFPYQGRMPMYDKRADNPNADFGQGNDVIVRGAPPVQPGNPRQPNIEGGGVQQFPRGTPAQRNAYSEWLNAQQYRNKYLNNPANDTGGGPFHRPATYTNPDLKTQQEINSPVRVWNGQVGSKDMAAGRSPFTTYGEAEPPNGLSQDVINQVQQAYPGNPQQQAKAYQSLIQQNQEMQNKVDVAKNQRLYGNEARGQTDVQRQQLRSQSDVERAQIAADAKTYASRHPEVSPQMYQSRMALFRGMVQSGLGPTPEKRSALLKELGLDPQDVVGPTTEQQQQKRPQAAPAAPQKPETVPQPIGPGIKEGSTVVNPSTGERLILQGGKWTPIPQQ